MVDCLIPCLITGSELVFQCQPDPGLNLWQPTRSIPRQFWANFWLKKNDLFVFAKNIIENRQTSGKQQQIKLFSSIFRISSNINHQLIEYIDHEISADSTAMEVCFLASGERLAVLDEEQFHGQSARDVKRTLADGLGVSRFLDLM